MRNIITLSFIILTTLGYSQKQYKRADNFFDKMQYIEAAKEYEEAINDGDRSKEILQKAGDAHYFNTNMQGAHKWYDKLVSEYPDDVEAEYIFRYAHALQGVGNNRSAKKWMKKFSEKASYDDLRADNYSQSTITLDDILALEPQFTLKNLSVNTEFSDFGPMYYNDQLVYSSSVDSSYYRTRKYHWNEQPFLNLLLGNINPSQTDVTFVAEFSKELNTKYHEATSSFSPDQKKVYFTRNNYNGNLGRDEEGVNHLKLYSAEIFEEGGKIKWGDIKELPFNSDDYSVGHPAVSKDGKKLYFVSDMPGTIGGTDIFVVDILENDQYTQPRNLGSGINTYGREMFPFITDKALYFASDGHLGLGGLDVFESKHGFTFETPENLGAPLNSSLDDFGFITNEQTNKGFVCSNRKSGKGDDDIYSFERTPIARCTQVIKGYVSNNITGERIAGATVLLYSDRGKKLEEAKTEINGDYSFMSNIDCSTLYKVEVLKTGFNPNEKPILTDKTNGEITMPIGLDVSTEFIVNEGGILKIKIGILYFDFGKSFIRNDAAIELNKIVFLMNQHPNMVIKIESHTDSRSPDIYNMKLSNQRAEATRDYIISQGIDASRIESAKGYGETKLVNECKNKVPCSEARHQLNRRTEFIIVKI